MPPPTPPSSSTTPPSRAPARPSLAARNLPVLCEPPAPPPTTASRPGGRECSKNASQAPSSAVSGRGCRGNRYRRRPTNSNPSRSVASRDCAARARCPAFSCRPTAGSAAEFSSCLPGSLGERPTSIAAAASRRRAPRATPVWCSTCPASARAPHRPASTTWTCSRRSTRCGPRSATGRSTSGV